MKWYAELIAVLLVSTLAGCHTARDASPGPDRGPNMAPVHVLGEDPHVRQWLVIGPFPNPKAEHPPGKALPRLGYDRDYLTELGGEAAAVLTRRTRVAFKDEQGIAQTAVAEPIQANSEAVINLDTQFEMVDYRVAYAFAYIRSDRDQTLYGLFGSDDSPKVWVNGKPAFAKQLKYGRAVTPRDDIFPLELHKGLNTVMVKVEEYVGGWAFIFEIGGADQVERLRAHQERKRLLVDFQSVGIRTEEWGDFIFQPGFLPKLVWEYPSLAEQVLGTIEMDVCWFDAEMSQVTAATKPGRYAAVINATGPKGLRVRRAITFYCTPKEYRIWAGPPKAYVEFALGDPIDPQAFRQRKERIASAMGKRIQGRLYTEADAAVVMVYLAEIKPGELPPEPIDRPEIIDADYHLALKRKLLGSSDAGSPLGMPQRIEGRPARVLRQGTPDQAGVKPDAAEKIRTLCRQWYDESREPFVILVARHGVIVIHQAFGERTGEPVTLDTPLNMASISKAMTGMMFAQFVDQGLIAIDDPVGKFLPDFPVEGDKVVTLRHCFTHTTGLEGHYQWGGVHNLWLDNVVANGLEYLTPGKTFLYNGMGYDLAGKVMEVVSGKSILRLMHENFFAPLGATHTTMDDLACCTQSTAQDIARMGQLLLNRGSYGDLEFFSPQTFEQLLPTQLSQFYPIIGVEWGIGLTWMRDPHPHAGKNGLPEDKTILSRNTIGHGAASGAILRVDLDNDLVVVQTRNTAGEHYEKYAPQFLQAVADSLTN